MFQVATLYSFALKHNLEYAVPLEVENPHYEGQKPYIFPGLNYCGKVPNHPLYKEPNFHYNEIPFMDNVVLDGYWQSFRYLDGYRDEVLKAFGFKYELQKGWCAVHVRRGDYLKSPDYHPFVGEEFLSSAVTEMNRIKGITKFRVFSNDISWCKDFFATIPDYTFEFVEGNNEIQDLEQGSWCETQILSNGTFSLWQYYLNQNQDKICIAPKRWFGKLLPHDTKDLYPLKAVII